MGRLVEDGQLPDLDGRSRGRHHRKSRQHKDGQPDQNPLLPRDPIGRAAWRDRQDAATNASTIAAHPTPAAMTPVARRRNPAATAAAMNGNIEKP